MKKNKFWAVVALLVGLASAPAMASSSDPQEVGTFGDWKVYTFTEAGNKVCFMSSQPKRAQGNYSRRGDIYAFITHWSGDNSKNVFSYRTGYTYKPKSTVTLTIGSRNFTLFTEGEMAWAYDQKSDDEIAQAITRGSSMVVKGTSARGTLTTDTYSLKGSADAYRKIGELCGV